MSKLNRAKFLWLFLVSSIVLAPYLHGQEEPRQSWTYGGIEYMLPKPAEQIIIPSNMPETYEVVSGDTLWGIANHFLKDPFLWPIIWDLNMDVVPNPHLIFPKQVLKLLTQ